MGVERFFSSIKKEFNITVNTQYPYKKIHGRYLCIDFNSIVHVLSAHLLNMYNKNNKTDKEEFEKELLNLIVEYLIELIKFNIYSDELEYIYIAIDGTPSMGKIYEQKKRRYMATLIDYIKDKEDIESSKFNWSKNNISPSTIFMKKLEKKLKYLYAEFRKYAPNLKKYILSGTEEEGEGEMKIINYIKKFHIKEDVVVYSPDSDMILLMLMLDTQSTILRYDQQNASLDEQMNGKYYNIINVSKFKEVLINYISSRKNPYYNIIPQRVINDIVFLFTVFGDDFLPKLENLRVSNDIYIILDYYLNNLLNNGYLLDNKNKIKAISFHNLLHLLSINEKLFLKRNKMLHIYSNYHRIETDILGFNMYHFRAIVNEIIWMFLHVKKAEKHINPHNAYKHYDHFDLIKFINNFFIEGKGANINVKELEKQAGMKFNYIDTNMYDELKKIFIDNYLLIIKYIDTDNFFKVINKNYRRKIQNQYNKLYYLMESKYQFLLDMIIYMFYSNLDTPVINSININPKMASLKENHYDSKIQPHIRNLLNKSKKEIFNYKIEKKLDQFYDIMNPEDKFYTQTDLSSESYYKSNHLDKTKTIKEYLRGLNWITNYYFNNIIDRTWYYKYSKSPLLKDIVEYLDNNKYDLREDITDNLKQYLQPLQQILLISPIDYSKDIKSQLEFIDYEDKDKIVDFINNNKKYYFDLSKIYDEIYTKKNKHIDCSTSIFISKCHLLFLENDINLRDYIKDSNKLL